MHSCSASSGKPDSNSLDCIVFSCLEVYRDWNRWNDEGFTFLGSDVSISWVYLLSQMLFWQLMYLHCLDIHCCRCSFLDQYICNLLFFELADTFNPACHVQLHLHLAFSITWGYSPQKFCILNLPFLHLADTPNWIFASSLPENPLSQISPLFFELHDLSRYITYKKIDIRNSREYGVSVGDTWSVNFCVNEFERTCLKLRSSKFEFKFICF